MNEYRAATVADIMKRMLAKPRYERYAVDALGWGTGDAQNDIPAAVAEAEKMGFVITERNHADGKPMVRLTEAGKAWGESTGIEPEETVSVAQSPATKVEQAKAQRLDELHAWLTEMCSQGVGTTGARGYKDAAALLFFIETGKRATEDKNIDAFDEFFHRIYNRAPAEVAEIIDSMRVVQP